MLQERITLSDKTNAFSIHSKHTTHMGGKGEYLHDWYAYLEGYSSEFVRSVYSSYMPNSKLVLEPFAGVGTTPLFLALEGIKSAYCEVNPVLLRVINTKLSIASLTQNRKEEIHSEMLKLSDALPVLMSKSSPDSALDDAYNLAFKKSSFFFEDAFENVLKLRTINDSILQKNPLLGSVLEIAVISNLVKCSKLKRAGDVRYKTSKELDRGIPELIYSVQKQLQLMANDCRRCPQSTAAVKLIAKNAKNLCNFDSIQADGLITSPPYLNGTNYFRNTKLELWYMRDILNDKSLRSFRNEVVTSGINDVTVNKGVVTHPFIKHIVEDLSENAYDKRISKMVSGYFEEMSYVLRGAAHHLVDGARACIDIGDSIYAGIHVPTHEILSVIAEENGFELLEIVKLRERKSHNKSQLSQSLIVLERRKGASQIFNINNQNAGSLAKQSECLRRWEIFKDTLPHMQPPYNKRNWGNGLHSVCSYQGKMKPALAYLLIKVFSDENDVVLDPFSGSGTIPLEAAINNRKSLGIDISLLATSLSNAKIMSQDKIKVLSIVDDLSKYISTNKPSKKTIKDTQEVKFNKTIPEYFHPDTLTEIMLARDFFIKFHIPEDGNWALVFSCLLHILHGNRPYALSRNSHPITPYAPTGEYFYKNLINHLLQKINKSLDTERGPNFLPGFSYLADILESWPDDTNNVDLIITSPPFYDSTKFYMTNWMRYWFCGWGKDDFSNQTKSFIEVLQKKSFSSYEIIFKKCHEKLTQGGMAVFHLGFSKKCDMANELKPLAEKYFEILDIFSESVEHCEKHGIKDKGSVKNHQYLVMKKSD